MSAIDNLDNTFYKTAVDKFSNLGYLYTLRHNESAVSYYNITGQEYVDNYDYITAYNFTYKYTFDFEREFSPAAACEWTYEHRWLCNLFIIFYIILIHSLKKIMENRQRFELRNLLVLWNTCLAVFSIVGAIRTATETWAAVETFGMDFLMCYTGPAFLDNRVGGFWNWMFTLSKVPELGDTVFIVLRKQPLIFLHWYHHVTVLLYSWYSYSDYIATARWFVLMNYIVHSIMYSYYALKALKFKVSKYVSMFITTAQLAQMVMGLVVNIWAYQVKQAGNECHVSYENIKISLIMYTSYFVLFAHFFRRAYMKKPSTDAQKPLKNGDASYDYVKARKGKFD